MNSFYTKEELELIGFKQIGENVLISRKASIYGASNISIGNNVRIDDFCILSGKIKIGSYIHISVGALLFAGDYGIYLEDYTTISSRTAIYAITDDYSGEFMVGPMLPDKVRNVIGGPVILKKYSAIASGCTVFPNIVIGTGAAVGAMSLVNTNIEPFSINVGIPAKKIKQRSKKIIELENKLRNEDIK